MIASLIPSLRGQVVEFFGAPDWSGCQFLAVVLATFDKCTVTVSVRTVCKKEESDSIDTLVLDDDAHKVNLHTHSYFFCIR